MACGSGRASPRTDYCLRAGWRPNTPHRHALDHPPPREPRSSEDPKRKAPFSHSSQGTGGHSSSFPSRDARQESEDRLGDPSCYPICIYLPKTGKNQMASLFYSSLSLSLSFSLLLILFFSVFYYFEMMRPPMEKREI